ncbi:MAG: Asp23/Gls24 family envelope stress response protein [Clostridiales bacterium]|nr:Asp23/Gls24 family envelope stress response protein [Clostridiales bacterium]
MTQQASDNYGKVTFADEVIAIIAGLAATEIPGVAAMSGGIAGGIVEKLGKKNLSKGVKVEVGEKETAIDLFIIVDYGVRIPEIAWNIQENVKKAVENMTGLNVIEVNIHIQGVNFEKELKKEEPGQKVR